MRTDELITATRRAAFIPDDHPEYTDAVVINEINRTFANVFAAIVVDSRGGFWRKRYEVAIVPQQPRYRIHPRACVGGLETITIGDSAGTYLPVREATPAQIDDFRGSATTSQARPLYFYTEGDVIELLPQPNATGYTLRQSYYVRPSRLVVQQSTTLGGGTVRGQITAASPTARTITVNAVPFDQELASPAAITSAVQSIDVVHPDGYHELALVGATQTLSGTTFTVGGTATLQDVQVGDFVRAAEQTDWPAIPDEFHQTLADATAVRILYQMNASYKADDLSRKIGLVEGNNDLIPGSDLYRFRKLITPRTQTNPKRVVRRSGMIGGYRRVWPGWQQ